MAPGTKWVAVGDQQGWYRGPMFGPSLRVRDGPCCLLGPQPAPLALSLSLKGRGTEELGRMKRTRTRMDKVRPRLSVADDVAWRTKQAVIDLRRAETPPERALWDALRDRRLGGRKFRRQQPIGPFVVDFYCAAERLVVEIDGSIHDDAGHIAADLSRQQAIETVGYRFVRIRSDLVLNDVQAALRMIEAALREP